MSTNILVVDDSRTARKVLIRTLELTEIPVTKIYEAGDGSEALAVLGEHAIDVVFTDINMPVMNAMELVDRMNADDAMKKIPVVLVSIEGSATRINEFKAKGVSARVRKPFTPELIREVLNEVLSVRMRARHHELLGQAFSQTMEDHAFMFCEAVEKSVIDTNADGYLHGHIGFSGQISGTVVIAVSEEMSAELAANVLGIETEADEVGEYARDALGELVNVVCGQTLTAIAGEGPVFDLFLPKTDSLDSTAWKALLDDSQTLAFLVDEYPVLLQLCLED